MRRNSGKQIRHRGYYRTDKLWQSLEREGFNSPYALAKHMRRNPDTMYRVFKGIATYKHVKPVADFFRINWSELHDV